MIKTVKSNRISIMRTTFFPLFFMVNFLFSHSPNLFQQSITKLVKMRKENLLRTLVVFCTVDLLLLCHKNKLKFTLKLKLILKTDIKNLFRKSPKNKVFGIESVNTFSILSSQESYNIQHAHTLDSWQILLRLENKTFLIKSMNLAKKKLLGVTLTFLQ